MIPIEKQQKDEAANISPFEQSEIELKQNETKLVVRFCQAWWASGQHRAKPGELIAFALAAGIPVAGASPRARQTSLGWWLRNHRRQVVSDNEWTYEIGDDSTYRKHKFYRIAAKKVPKSKNVYTG